MFFLEFYVLDHCDMEKFIVGGRHYYWTAAPTNPGLQFCGCKMGEHLCTSLEILWGRASSCVLTPACMYCSSSSSSSSSSTACTVKRVPTPSLMMEINLHISDTISICSMVVVLSHILGGGIHI